MLYKIVLTTTETVTVECDGIQEAHDKASKMAQEASLHAHHGEKTTAEVAID